MKQVIALMTVALSLVGCATPSTLMKNPTTGQIARCGGDASGSMMGGYIGYSIQKSNDEQCVKDYASQGFIPIQESH